MLPENGNVFFPKNGNVFVAVFRQAFLAKSVRPFVISLTWLPKNGNKNVAVFRQGWCRARSDCVPHHTPDGRPRHLSATVNIRPTEPTQAADAASLTYGQVDQARHHNTNHLR